MGLVACEGEVKEEKHRPGKPLSSGEASWDRGRRRGSEQSTGAALPRTERRDSARRVPSRDAAGWRVPALGAGARAPQDGPRGRTGADWAEAAAGGWRVVRAGAGGACKGAWVHHRRLHWWCAQTEGRTLPTGRGLAVKPPLLTHPLQERRETLS